MKTLYWSFLFMAAMAYTQNTEKENEFTMSMQIRPSCGVSEWCIDSTG